MMGPGLLSMQRPRERRARLARAVRILFVAVFLLSLCACGGKIRRDFGGGGGGNGDADVMILQDRPAVELSIWEGAVVFDLRDYDSWAQGHVPGARHVTVQDLKDGRGLPEDLDAPLLFMGDGPLDSSAELAADVAVKRGHTDVQLFPGGWRAWIGDRPVDN